MEEVEKEKRYSKLEWIFYIIVLPCLFTVILIGMILTFLKVDVISPLQELGNKIPILEKIIPDPKESKQTDLTVYDQTFNPKENQEDPELEKLKNDISQYQEQIKEKDAKIKELENKINTLETDLNQAHQDLNDLLAQQSEKKAEEDKAKAKEMADIYGSMTASKAAPILSSLTNQEAVSILSEMDSKKQALILAKMDPQKAGELSVLLMKDSNQTANQ